MKHKSRPTVSVVIPILVQRKLENSNFRISSIF